MAVLLTLGALVSGLSLAPQAVFAGDKDKDDHDDECDSAAAAAAAAGGSAAAASSSD